MPLARPLPFSRRTLILRSLTCTLLLATSPALAQTFTPIPLPSTATSARATAISGDGTTVVGIAQTSVGPRAFSWSAAAGTQILPVLPTWTATEALAISGDGSMMVGMAQTAAGERPALWSTRPGVPPAQELPLLPGETEAEARAISADGNIVVGFSSPSLSFRWTSSGGVEPLPPIGPFGISADGNVVVGWGGEWGAYWTSAGGAVVLFQPPSLPNQHSYATAVSADGSVIVGARDYFGRPSAIRWDVDIASGKYEWKWLQETGRSMPLGINADGSVIAGLMDPTNSGDQAILWHHDFGIVNVRERLNSWAQPVGGWTLEAASAISADGHTIAGWGEHNGVERAWAATLPPRTFCYANCDNSTTEPILNVDDFICFINDFAHSQGLPIHQQMESYANCDRHFNPPPILSVDDFTCFINEFAAGCP